MSLYDVYYLKTGMLVELRDGEIYKVLNDTPFKNTFGVFVGDGLETEERTFSDYLVTSHGSKNHLSIWDNYLRHGIGSEMSDIMKIYAPNAVENLLSFDLTKFTLIWKR